MPEASAQNLDLLHIRTPLTADVIVIVGLPPAVTPKTTHPRPPENPTSLHPPPSPSPGRRSYRIPSSLVSHSSPHSHLPAEIFGRKQKWAPAGIGRCLERMRRVWWVCAPSVHRERKQLLDPLVAACLLPTLVLGNHEPAPRNLRSRRLVSASSPDYRLFSPFLDFGKTGIPRHNLQIHKFATEGIFYVPSQSSFWRHLGL